jgi:hypothetical protein
VVSLGVLELAQGIDLGGVSTCPLASRAARSREAFADVLPIDEAQLEDFVLANAPAFVASMQAADRELAAGQTQSLQKAIEGR